MTSFILVVELAVFVRFVNARKAHAFLTTADASASAFVLMNSNVAKADSFHSIPFLKKLAAGRFSQIKPCGTKLAICRPPKLSNCGIARSDVLLIRILPYQKKIAKPKI